jgi:hypothetical protein
MEDKELTEDYLRNRLNQTINNARLSFNSCTLSTIRWLQRYSHCYSIACSFICFPLWILMLPIAICLDICIFSIISIVFVVAFVLFLLFAPCILSYQISSCSAAWHPVNIYRYSLTQALLWSEAIFIFFEIYWWCYCGTGDIESGAPICCIYCCPTPCQHACKKATRVKISEQHCTIL